MKPEELIVFCTGMALYLRAGNSLSDCLDLERREAKGSLSQGILDQLYRDTAAGTSLTEALRATGGFPVHVLTMVEAGERTGHLEQVFTALSREYTRQHQLRETIRSAVAHPLLLLVITLVVIFAVIPQVLPIYSQVFAQLGGNLPLPTYLVLLAAEKLRSTGWIAGLAGGMAAVAALLVLGIPSWREAVCRQMVVCAFHKKTGSYVRSARFAALVQMGVSGGLDLEETLGLIQRSFAEQFLDDRPKTCQKKMAEGLPFARAVEETGLLSPLNCRLLAMGIQTGQEEEILEEIVQRTQEEADKALDSLLGKMEPAIVLTMSALVAVVLAAVLFPLLGILSAMTGV